MMLILVFFINLVWNVALAEAEGVEEFEDKDGNVFSKKMYEDLKRQGLL